MASALPPTGSFFDDWTKLPMPEKPVPSYRAGWELFIRHLLDDAPFPYGLIEGAKGVQLAEAVYRSSRERRWIDLPPLAL
jgi:hypothetical protein